MAYIINLNFDKFFKLILISKKGRVAPTFYQLVSVNANALLAAALHLKLHCAVDECVQGIVGALAYAYTGMDVSASLANDDVAGNNCLAISLLNAKTLGLTVTAVLGRTYALFVSEKLQTDSKHFSILRYKISGPSASLTSR